MTDTETGYLETPYLVEDYGSGQIGHHIGMQVTQIINKQKTIGMQASMTVSTTKIVHMQASMVINANKHIKMQTSMIVSTTKSIHMQVTEVISAQKNIGMQTSMTVTTTKHVGMQASQFIVNRELATHMQVTEVIGATKTDGMQATQTINKQKTIGMQAAQTVVNKLHTTGMQANMIESANNIIHMQATQVINKQKLVGMQANMVNILQPAYGMMASQFLVSPGFKTHMEAKQDKLKQHLCEVYLNEGGYLEDAYLAECIEAYLYMQVNMVNKIQFPVGMQANMIVGTNKHTGMQAAMTVNTQKNYGMQAQMFNKFTIGMQSTMVIYNVTQLRIMTTFPSRGTAALLGLNWTASSTASGDYSANNLNTDVIEEAFRSGPSSASLVTLTSDTGLSQGVPLDTIAILGHNLTKSATVQVQGSNDPFFGSINISFNMTTELENMYYIAPSFPTLLGQNRYWRFVIQDPTNSSGYIEIGAILYGASHIFSVLESFNNPINRGFKHFKDVLNTEGFTNVMNDRALKKFLKLRFEKLNFFNRNYSILEDMIMFARESLKVLVIPTPEFASRFAIYGKIVKLPEVSHTSNGAREEYIDLDIEWDESL